MAVRVQDADFDVGAELEALTRGNRRIGGLAVFVGLVREMHVREGLHRDRIDALTLEHYPGMTEKALEDIESEARRRWPPINRIAPDRTKSAGQHRRNSENLSGTRHMETRPDVYSLPFQRF